MRFDETRVNYDLYAKILFEKQKIYGNSIPSIKITFPRGEATFSTFSTDKKAISQIKKMQNI